MSGSAAWRWPGLGQLDRWSPGAEVRNILDSRRLERRGVERTANADSDSIDTVEAAVGSLQGREADAVICVVFVIVMFSIRANLLICSRGSEHGHLDRLGWTYVQVLSLIHI